MNIPTTTTVEQPKMTPAQYESHSRMNAQRSFKSRKVLLQHAHGLPFRTQIKKK